MSTVKTSKAKDIEFVEFYNEFFNSIGWPPKSLKSFNTESDLSLTDLVLLITADGDLYGVNRDNGKINWVLRGLNFVTKSGRDMTKMDNQSNYKQHILSNVDFFWFLEPVDDGSIYVFDFRIGVYKLAFNIKQLVKLSPYSFPGDDKVYIGRKETSLFVVDVNTGEIYQSFFSDRQYYDSNQCFSDGSFQRYCDRGNNIIDIHDKNVLKIGRVDYILNVYSGNRLLWNVTYSEWVPSFINANLENMYTSMFDGKYILSTHNGGVFQHNITGVTSITWSKRFDTPIIKVFDILSFVPTSVYHQSGLNKQHIFIMVEQPSDFVFKMFKSHNRHVFINVTQMNSWYALSEEKFPLIREASLSRWYNSAINFGKLGILPLYIDLVGLHRILYDMDQIFTIGSSHESLETDYFLNHKYGLKYQYFLFIFLICGLFAYFLWKGRRWCYLFISVLKIKCFTLIMYMKKENNYRFWNNISIIFNKSNRKYANLDDRSNEVELSTEDMLLSNEINHFKVFHLKKRRKGVQKNKKYKKEIENTEYINMVETVTEDEVFEKNQIEYNNDNSHDTSLDFLAFKKYDSVEDIKFPLVINSLIITDKILGYGSHGTVVYEGSFEGRKVAVKRMLLEFYEIAFREITLLQESDGHPNVIRYYCKQKSDKFLYIALELCSASLYDIVERSCEFSWLLKLTNVSNILYQIALGIQYLHSLKIVHRDIKPQNILVVPLYAKSSDNKDNQLADSIRIVISDFGLCKKLELDQSSFKMTSSQLSGTIGWRAPELFYGKECTSDRIQTNTPYCLENSVDFFRNHKVSRAIDIFSMGCVFYYVLTKGMHPFGEYYFREGNIVKGSADYSHLDFLGNETFLAKDLISKMLNLNPNERPDVSFVVKHPYFWTSEKKLSFLVDVSDRFEAEKCHPSSELLLFLERDVLNIIGRNWQKKINKHILENSGKFRKYDGTKLLDLLRILRNKKNHYQNLPFNVREILGPPPDLYLSYFMTRFPHLLLHCYYVKEKKKVEIVFDAEARKEYLTGFHKRKVKRRRKANFMKQERNEKLKMKAKKDIGVQNCIRSNLLIQDINNIIHGPFENFDVDECKKHNVHISQNKYDQNDTTVTIIEGLT
ncbi:hypothetical protein PORY_001476 [Pneumocystis oryctolagi]|uniref:Uncharacterized protein n=1 Tax=Pneumocystis oryctolagi TaxID=42067 RepID=A0ACB7CCP3_9ASCO|nr:hypothetical protein PORY_001476 [Pneumocystis oryctolagi]